MYKKFKRLLALTKARLCTNESDKNSSLGGCYHWVSIGNSNVIIMKIKLKLNQFQN
jgi:hypothetical protein